MYSPPLVSILRPLLFSLHCSFSLKKQGTLHWTFNFLCPVNRAQRLKFRLNLYELKEGRQIKPKTFMSMVSNLLYERRWVCTSVYYIKYKWNGSGLLCVGLSLKVWTLLHWACDCWTRPQNLGTIHLLPRFDWLSDGDGGLCCERYLLRTNVWHVWITVGARYGK